MIKYHSIPQYRNVVRQVREHCEWNHEPLPVLTFRGTVKIHGTNSSVVKNLETGDITCQSRNNPITIGCDNAGFAGWVHDDISYQQTPKSILSMFFEDVERYIESSKYKSIVMYGEWCGPGIHKGVAINQIDGKKFMIFDIKLVVSDEEYDWFDFHTNDELNHPRVVDVLNKHDIFLMSQFISYTLSVDFSRPDVAQSSLIELTESVERECPVAMAFGIRGIGEGIVWTCDDLERRLIFKVKGQKHSVTKVKKLASVDVEKMNNIHEFLDSVVTEHRLEQAIDFLRENGKIDEYPTERHTGEVIKWFMKDIFKEESDTMDASGITTKELGKYAPTKIRDMYFNHLSNNL